MSLCALMGCWWHVCSCPHVAVFAPGTTVTLYGAYISECCEDLYFRLINFTDMLSALTHVH